MFYGFFEPNEKTLKAYQNLKAEFINFSMRKNTICRIQGILIYVTFIVLFSALVLIPLMLAVIP
jgi:hypothetical protein